MEIVELVKKHAPITGEQIAEMLGLSRPTLRSDLSVLVMLGYLDAKPKVGYFLGNLLSLDNRVVTTLKELKVRDVQGMPVIIKDSSSVNDAVVTLFMENVGSLIVADDEGMLQGIVSRKDLLKVTLGNPGSTAMPISLVMTRMPNVITVVADDSVVEAARKMIHHQVDSLPVVRKPSEDQPNKYEVIGRISKTSMTGILLDLATGSL